MNPNRKILSRSWTVEKKSLGAIRKGYQANIEHSTVVIIQSYDFLIRDTHSIYEITTRADLAKWK